MLVCWCAGVLVCACQTERRSTERKCGSTQHAASLAPNPAGADRSGAESGTHGVVMMISASTSSLSKVEFSPSLSDVVTSVWPWSSSHLRSPSSFSVVPSSSGTCSETCQPCIDLVWLIDSSLSLSLLSLVACLLSCSCSCACVSTFSTSRPDRDKTSDSTRSPHIAHLLVLASHHTHHRP